MLGVPITNRKRGESIRAFILRVYNSIQEEAVKYPVTTDNEFEHWKIFGFIGIVFIVISNDDGEWGSVGVGWGGCTTI